MALDKVTFHLPFVQGQEQRAGDLYLPAPGLDKLQDMELDRTGEVSKRLGATRLTNTVGGQIPVSMASENKGLAVRAEEELVQINGKTLYGYSGDEWIGRGEAQQDAWLCQATQQSVGVDLSFETSPRAYGRVGGFDLYCFRSGKDFSLVLRDAGSNAIFATREFTSAAFDIDPKIAVDYANEVFYFAYLDGLGTVDALRIRTDSNIHADFAAAFTSLALGTAAGGGRQRDWDVQWDATNLRLCGVVDNGIAFRPFTFSQTLAAQSQTSIGPVTGTVYKYALAVYDGRMFVFYHDGTNVECARLNNNSVTFDAAISIAFPPEPRTWGTCVTGTGVNGSIYLFLQSFEDETGAAIGTLPSTDDPYDISHIHRVRIQGPAETTPTVTKSGYMRRAYMASLPSIVEGGAGGIPILLAAPDVKISVYDVTKYVPLETGRFQNTTNYYFGDSVSLFLMDGRYGYEDELDDTRGLQPLARMLPGQYVFRDAFSTTLQNVPLPLSSLIPSNSTLTAFTCPVGTDNTTQMLTFDFDTKRCYEGVAAGGSVYYPGGYLSLYDGDRLKEAAPLVYPDNVQAERLTSGAILSNSKTYTYACYWVMRNAQGEIVRSTTIPGSIELGASDERVKLYVPTLQFSRLPLNTDEIWLEVYRSAADPADTTAPRFLVSGTNSGVSIDVTLPPVVYNDPTVSYVEFDDDVIQDDIRDAEAWGRTPADPFNAGELDQVPALAPQSLHLGQNRLFYVGPDVDGNDIYYSKLRSDGQIFSFNEGLTGLVPEQGGQLKGIYAWEDRVTAFRERATYSLSGVGPDNTGRGSYGLAQVIDAATGLTDSRAMAAIPGGLMFHAERGWHFLNRADQTAYIGSGVDELRFDNTDEECTGCVVVPDQHRVICFSNQATRTAVYDYLVQQWAVYGGDYQAQAARLFNGEPYWLRVGSDGRISYPDTTWADEAAGSNVGGIVETAWLKVDRGQGSFGDGGISGWGRNYWWELVGICDREGSGVENPFPIEPLKVRVAYNYNTSASGPVWEDIFYYTFATGPFRIRERFKGSRQKSAAVKFEFSGLTVIGAASVRNLTLQALSLQVGLKSGVTRAPATGFTV